MAATTERKKWQTYYASEGRFYTLDRENNITGEYDTITGALDSTSLYIGTSKGKPKEFLRIVLDDGDTMQVVRCGAGTTFHRMFAGYLAAIQSGMQMRLQIASGGDNEKVSSCFVQVADESGEWVKPEYTKLREQFPNDDDCNNEARRLVTSHWSFKQYVPRHSQQQSDAPNQYELRFADMCAALGWPIYGSWPQLYIQWFQEVWRGMSEAGMAVPDPLPQRCEQIADKDFMPFIDLLRRHKDMYKQREYWPAPLLHATEYNPFAGNEAKAAAATPVAATTAGQPRSAAAVDEYDPFADE